MAHFAKIENDIVVDVIVIDNEHEANGQQFINETIGLSGEWVQTSYNGNIRKNFAGIGFTYDRNNDVFIAPKPTEGFETIELILNSDFQWVAKETPTE